METMDADGTNKTIKMAKIILVLYILCGKVVHTDQGYTIVEEGIDYACEGEVINWIETGSFKYDDFLCDCE